MNLIRGIPSTANDDGNVMGGHHAGRQMTTVLPRSPAEALEPLRPPEPPDREPPEEDSHPFLRMFDGFFTFIFILACGALAVFYFVRMEFDRPGPLAASTVIVVPRGEGVTAIAERLERDGVIADRRIFMTSILYFMYLKGQGTLKAGEYEFDKHATMRQVLDTLVQGKSVEHKVTLPEGLTSEQIVARLAAHPDLNGAVTETPPEGSLLPDTYSFASHDTRDDIIQRMRVAQQKFLAKVWQERDPDVDGVVKTPEEALILASIVEKETGRADERPHIASVFENRLRKRMRLQSDPTVIYGLFGGEGMGDHPITQDDLDQDNPYNTYKIAGLPPTPIANPGRAAIEAVLKPAKTNDLYFCADGTGGHAFAATLAEHNKNVTRWRKIEAEIRAKQEEEAAAAAGAAPGEAAPGATTAEAETTAGAPAASGAPPAPVADGGVPLPIRNPKR
jgi:peptidoglycan lytic transglycosylase G